MLAIFPLRGRGRAQLSAGWGVHSPFSWTPRCTCVGHSEETIIHHAQPKVRGEW